MTALVLSVVQSAATVELATSDGGSIPAPPIPISGGLLGNFAQSNNSAALVADPSPATLLDGTPYSSAASSRGTQVSISMHGTLDAQGTVSAQIYRGAFALGTPVTMPSDAAGKFGGTILVLEDHHVAGPVTYSVLLTAAGRTFTVPEGACNFVKVDLPG